MRLQQRLGCQVIKTLIPVYGRITPAMVGEVHLQVSVEVLPLQGRFVLLAQRIGVSIPPSTAQPLARPFEP